VLSAAVDVGSNGAFPFISLAVIVNVAISPGTYETLSRAAVYVRVDVEHETVNSGE